MYEFSIFSRILMALMVFAPALMLIIECIFAIKENDIKRWLRNNKRFMKWLEK